MKKIIFPIISIIFSLAYLINYFFIYYFNYGVDIALMLLAVLFCLTTIIINRHKHRTLTFISAFLAFLSVLCFMAIFMLA